MTTWILTPWTRRSLRCRIGALLALMLTLPGLTGCFESLPRPTQGYNVPGIDGEVDSGPQVSSDGRRYYGISWWGDDGQHQRVVYEGSREFAIIDAFFRGLNKPSHPSGDRSSIPGGAGTLPPPAVH